jgi:hypothetical protein
MVTRVVHDEGDFGVEVVLASEFEVDHFPSHGKENWLRKTTSRSHKS